MHRLRIDRFRWPAAIEEKVFRKHGLHTDEVEDSFFYSDGKIRKQADRYRLFSRTSSGEYVIVIFEYRLRLVTVISAREMTERERRLFRRK